MAMTELTLGMIRDLERHDPATALHCRRVARLVAQLGGAGLYEAALCHDLGKLAIDPALLQAPRALTEQEWGLMRAHPWYGLDELRRRAGCRMPARHAWMMLCHHERWDGQGYPCGLAGEAIPLAARICAVADAYDAMRSARAHSPAKSHGVALAALEAGAGSQFDPQIVHLFSVRDNRRVG